MYSRNDKITLHLDSVRNVFVVDANVDFTLHHSGSTIIFDETFPARLGHLQVLSKTLLSKVLNSIIISICHKVLDTNSLSMSFQSIH